MGAQKENNTALRMKKGPRYFMRTYRHEIFFAVVVLTCVSLLSSVVLLMAQYTGVLDEQVAAKALMNSADAVEALDERIDRLKFEAVLAAGEASRYTEKDDFISACLERAAFTMHVTRIVYCKDQVLYDLAEQPYQSDSNDRLLEASTLEKVSVLEDIKDSERSMMQIAFCIPLKEHPVADSMIMICSLTALRDIETELSDSIVEQTDYLSLCRTEGEIVANLTNLDRILGERESIYDGVLRLTGEKEDVFSLRSMAAGDDSSTCKVQINGKNYVLALAKSHRYHTFFFVSLSESEKLYSSVYEFVTVIIVSVTIVLVLVLIFCLYFILSKKKINKKLADYGTMNEQLQCLSRAGFEREAGKSLEQYKGSRFAVVSLRIRRFEYISGIAGSARTQELLRRLRTLINGKMQLAEVFGSDEQGEFLLLLQYSKYDALITRLRELYHLTINGLSTVDYTVKLYFGICVRESGADTKIAALIANAKYAMDRGGMEKVGGNYTRYDAEMRSEYMEISDLEIRTDQSIQNRDFHVLFQPKYNLDQSRIDGSEALIRWYDEKTGTYLLPEKFLPLQEANGNIVRLDRYVFEEVCRFVHTCATEGTPIVPVSVNVSRLSMVEPDFVEFYTATKKRYCIPDRFLTLEFTESAAYENYAEMQELLALLHQSGFNCSIDDFGTGYSSYKMLKLLEVDEVKMDRFFIVDCLKNDRAKYILEGAIAIGNRLKVKVTQEGVEDFETLSYLKRLGCNVIQGYYYSKPLPQEEFLEFIQQRHLQMEHDPGRTE